MSENLHDIDKLFKDGIEGQEQIPSAKVWDAIDNNLDKSNVVQIKRKYNNLKHLAVALLLLLLGTVVYEIQSKKTAKKELAYNNTVDTIAAIITAPKTVLNKEENKENTPDKATANATNMGNDSSAISNAEKNSTTNSSAGYQQNFNQTTKSYLPQKDKLKIDGSSILNKNGENGVVKNNELFAGSRAIIKKSSTHKTKISIKNAIAKEDIIITEDELEKTITNNQMAPIKFNGLRLLQNDKLEKIGATFEKDNFIMRSAKRISPEVKQINALAKNTKQKNSKALHFNVTAFYSPQFTFNDIKEEPHGGQPSGPGGPPPPPGGNSREHFKNEEQQQTAFTTGVLVDVPFAKKWGVQSGIIYLNKKIGIEPKKIFAQLDRDGKAKYVFDCSSGYSYIASKTGATPAVGDSINVTASTNSLGYLAVPLAVNYTFTTGKFSIIPSLGTAINFLVKQQIQTALIVGQTKEKQNITNIQGLKPTYFTATTGVAIEYSFSKRMALNLTPQGSFALTSINKDAAVKSYPNSFGVAAGLKIKF